MYEIYKCARNHYVIKGKNIDKAIGQIKMTLNGTEVVIR